MTTTADKKNETLTTYVSDVHALVAHGLQAIELQVENLKDVSHQDAKTAVAKFASVLSIQKGALESRVKELGGSTTGPVKDVVSAVAGVAAGVINKIRPSEAAKSIRDDYTFFSHLNIAWLMLYTTASSLGDEMTATLAKKGYGEVAGLVMYIDKIMPKIVVEELGEEKELAPKNVTDETWTMVKSAWNRESLKT